MAGRNVGPWLSAFAYGTTYFSAVIFIGYAGKLGWSFGMATVWIGIGNAVIGSYLAWKVLGNRTRAYTRRLEVSTMPEFFMARYNSRGLKILSAVVIFVFLTPYCASVYQGLAYLFESTLGIPFVWCMVGMAVLTALYLVLGGYMANVMSNFVQGICMVLGVGLMMNMHIFWGVACMILAVRTPKFLQDFIITTGGGGGGAIVNNAYHSVRLVQMVRGMGK